MQKKLVLVITVTYMPLEKMKNVVMPVCISLTCHQAATKLMLSVCAAEDEAGRTQHEGQQCQ
jgi:hypothetical protein